MSKAVIKRFTVFDSTDLTAAEDYFSGMAEKGWMLKKFGLVSEFYLCEPQKARFSVQLLVPNRGEDFGKRINGYTQLCGEAGWRLVSNYGGMYVFTTDRCDIPEIETDPEERIAAVTKQCRGGILVSWLMLLITLFPVIGLISNLIKGKSFVSQLIYEIPMALVFVSWLLLAIVKTQSFVKWRREARRALENGASIRYYGIRSSRFRTALYYIAIILIYAAMTTALLGLFFKEGL